jgi:hypothetical protein
MSNDDFLRSELRAAEVFATKLGMSVDEYIHHRRKSDRKSVATAVRMAVGGSFGVLSAGEQCAARLVVSSLRRKCDSIEQDARRCGLAWLRALRDLYPEAEGLHLIPQLEAEARGAPWRNLEENAKDAASIDRARALSKIELDQLRTAANTYPDRDECDLVIFYFGSSEESAFKPIDTTTAGRVGSHRPGCVAVGGDGAVYVSVGGTFERGSERWESIAPPPGPSPAELKALAADDNRGDDYHADAWEPSDDEDITLDRLRMR